MPKYIFFQEDDSGDVLTDIHHSCFGMAVKSAAAISAGLALVLFFLHLLF